VSGLTSGSNVAEGQFEPANAVFQALTPTEFSAQGKVAIVPNDVSRPAVVESLYAMEFSTATDP